MQLQSCPYLDTIRRHHLDFDFEKVCSVSLSNVNVYGCLVCGRYFQGKGKNSHAYTHSLEVSHHLFINLETTQVVCLPDGYNVDDPTFEDIKWNLKPQFSVQQAKKIEDFPEWSKNLEERAYLPGTIGFNNLKNTQFLNVVLQLLIRVKPLRQYLLCNDAPLNSPLLSKLSTLARRAYNPKNFKGAVSPHEFMQAVVEISQRKFQIGKEDDPINFLLWLLNNVEAELRKQKVKQLHLLKLFRGKLKTSFFKPLQKAAGYEDLPSKVQELPFLMLTAELPSRIINQQKILDRSINQNILTSIYLQNLLKKYEGLEPQDTPEGRKYILLCEMPSYLLIKIARFNHNGYFKQKNSTIVLYPIHLQISGKTYQLQATVCHEGEATSSIYKIYIRRGEAGNWFMIQDLRVEEVMSEEVIRAQAYLQLYKKI